MMDELNDLKQAAQARDTSKQQKASVKQREKQTAAELREFIAEQKARLKQAKPQ
jgi:hypothetical protein